MLAVPLASQGRPHGIAPDAPLNLATSYESNPRRWTLRSWFDLYSGKHYRITTAFPGGGMGTAGVKSLGSVAGAYPFHPEPKRCGPDGKPCGKRTTGLLSRRPVRAAGTVCIGKEAHRLDERGLVAGLDELHSVYLDPRREPWSTVVLPALRVAAAQPGGMARLADVADMTQRRLRDVLNGRSRPRETVRVALAALVPADHIRGSETPVARRCAARICAGCGEPLSRCGTHPSPRARFCSRSCKQRAYERRYTTTPPLSTA